MKNPLRKSICFIAMASFALSGQANLNAGRLFSAYEWSQICSSFEEADLISMCQTKVFRGVAYGRSMGTFEPVTPESPSVLQSRSGVFFKRSLNDIVTAIREDNGMRTKVQLQDDVQCQTYSTAPDLVGSPRTGHSYSRLIDSWLKEYTDVAYDTRGMKVAVDSRKTLQFDVLTAKDRIVSGVYAFDEKANAGIFSTCEHPANSAAGKRNAAVFFKSVHGSSRRFS